MPKPPVLFRTADQFRATNASPAEVLRESESVAARIEYLQRGAADGGPTDAESAEVRGLTKTLSGLTDLLGLMTTVDRRGVVPAAGPDGIYWANPDPLGAAATPSRQGLRGQALDVLDRTERSDGHVGRSVLDAVAQAVDADETDAMAAGSPSPVTRPTGRRSTS